ncbi:hypothetical protein FTX61_04675 [Nitriliruptoraceae bacterium ZYF776]|nr:hypothetical protein [Profundirhabdus halotolerans]
MSREVTEVTEGGEVTEVGEVGAPPRRRLPDVNPVLRRELLERWRGRRAVLVLTLYVAAIGALLLLLRWIGTQLLIDQQRWNPSAAMAAGPLLGRFLFENLLTLVLGLVLLVAPGYAAAQLSGERERRTLGLLRITLVRPRSIVLGKLGASTAWIVLLVVVTAPLAASAIVLGGVTFGDLVRGITVVLVVAVGVAAIALAVSSRARRTTGAVVTTYAIVLALVGGTVAAGFAQYAFNDFRRIDLPAPLYLNPVVALADATNARPVMGSQLPSILEPVASLLSPEEFDAVALGGVAMDGFDGVFAEERVVGQMTTDADGFPLARAEGTPNVWLITLALYALLTVGSVVIASRSLGPRDGVRET